MFANRFYLTDGLVLGAETSNLTVSLKLSMFCIDYKKVVFVTFSIGSSL